MLCCAQPHPTLWGPLDCSPPGSSVHGIFQTWILEWVAMLSSRGSSWPRDQTCIACVSCISNRFFTTEQLGKLHLKYTILNTSVSPCVHAQSCPNLDDPVDYGLPQSTGLSMGFPRQGNWSGLPYPPPEDLPDPEIKPRSPVLQAGSLPLASPGTPLEG